MMKIKILLIPLFISIISNGQNADVLKYANIYAFVNNISTNKKSVINLNDNGEFGKFPYDTTYIFNDSLFSKEDVKYFRLQIKLMTNFYWDSTKIKNAILISHKTINEIFEHSRNGWTKFEKQYGNNCLTSFSMPIFTIDETYCIFYQWNQCDYLTGRGDRSLYKKINDKWVKIKSYSAGGS